MVSGLITMFRVHREYLVHLARHFEIAAADEVGLAGAGADKQFGGAKRQRVKGSGGVAGSPTNPAGAVSHQPVQPQQPLQPQTQPQQAHDADEQAVLESQQYLNAPSERQNFFI